MTTAVNSNVDEVCFQSKFQDEFAKSLHTRIGGNQATPRNSTGNNDIKSAEVRSVTVFADQEMMDVISTDSGTNSKRKRSVPGDGNAELPPKRRRTTIKTNVVSDRSRMQNRNAVQTFTKQKQLRKQKESLKEPFPKKSGKASLRSSLPTTVCSKRKSNPVAAKRQSLDVLQLSPKLKSRSQNQDRVSHLRPRTSNKSADSSPVKLRERRKTPCSSATPSPSTLENCGSKARTGSSVSRKGSSASKYHLVDLSSMQCMNKRNVSPSKKPVTYRLNGSPKLNNLPTVLSLNSLSGIPNQRVNGGTTFSSLRQTFGGANISGTPPLLPKNGTSPFSLVSRPSSLSLSDTEKSPNTFRQCAAFDKKTNFLNDNSNLFSTCIEQQQTNSSRTRTGSKRLSLADSVEFMRKQSPGSGSSTLNRFTACKPQEDVDNKPLTPSPSPVSSCSSEVIVASFKHAPVSSSKMSPYSSPKRSQEMSLWKNSSGRRQKSYLFAQGHEVLARWHDGLFYLGKILKIDEKNDKCLLRYEDNSEYWSLFKDIHRGARDGEMLCCLCLGEMSDRPNEIVICDYCGQGYHQKCHSPYIDSGEVLDPDDEWCCRQCVFCLAAKRGGALKDGTHAQQLRKMKHTLPYNLHRLTWDAQHRSNVEQCYCYCGGPGIWHQKMLQCCRCKQWFHEACLQCSNFPLLCADSFYIFVCGLCNNHTEYLKRLDIDWSDITHIALYNLTMERNRKFFHFDDDIIPWLTENWEALQLKGWEGTTEEERRKLVEESLVKSKTRFVNGMDTRRTKAIWSLRVKVPPPPRNITLPFEGEVNDEVMDKLKVKGRRSKVFIPCQSSLVLKRSPGYSSLSPGVPSPSSNSWSTKVDDTGCSNLSGRGALSGNRRSVKVSLLDKLIPWPDSFTKENNPFLYEVEADDMKKEREDRGRIWKSALTIVDDTLSHSSFETGSTVSSIEGPPILLKEEGPIIPSLNLSPPQLEEAGKKKGTPKSGIQVSGESESVKRRKRLPRGSKANTTDTAMSSSTQAPSKTDVQFIKSKDGEETCITVYEKCVYSKTFHILGKRSNEAGELQYLVDWD